MIYDAKGRNYIFGKTFMSSGEIVKWLEIDDFLSGIDELRNSNQDKKTEEWKVTCPCKADQGNEWCVFKSEEKFRHVVEEGFPDRRRVVIG